MPRPLLCALAAIALLSGCMTRDGLRDLPWELGGYADAEGAAFGHHVAPQPRAEAPGS